MAFVEHHASWNSTKYETYTYNPTSILCKIYTTTHITPIDSNMVSLKLYLQKLGFAPLFVSVPADYSISSDTIQYEKLDKHCATTHTVQSDEPFSIQRFVYTCSQLGKNKDHDCLVFNISAVSVDEKQLWKAAIQTILAVALDGVFRTIYVMYG